METAIGPADAITPGSILLAATPIGCSADASGRLVNALVTADLIAAEDTRRLLALAGRLGVKVPGRVVSLHEHNEQERAPWVVEQAQNGARVLAVTDAGMPGVSDPGLRLVQAAVAAGVPVTMAPGPSAALTALALSGLASDRFVFEGFLPRKVGERAEHLADMAKQPRTMIFFESPRRVEVTLRAMIGVFGQDRPAALCRELTKVHEEVIRGSLGKIQRALPDEVLGEIVLVVAGYVPEGPEPGSLELAAASALELSRAGLRLKDAAAFLSKHLGLRAKDIYEAALVLKRER